MNANDLKAQSQKGRSMTMVSIRMPADVVADLKRIAPQLGFSGYQPLMRAYIGQGLRADLERLEGETAVSHLIESLRQQGVAEEVLQTAVAETRALYQVETQISRPDKEREIKAYHRLHAALLQQYAGQYVAIHDGKLVDHDTDRAALLRRIEAKYPETFVLIRPVWPEPEIVYKYRSARWA